MSDNAAKARAGALPPMALPRAIRLPLGHEQASLSHLFLGGPALVPVVYCAFERDAESEELLRRLQRALSQNRPVITWAGRGRVVEYSHKMSAEEPEQFEALIRCDALSPAGVAAEREITRRLAQETQGFYALQ